MSPLEPRAQASGPRAQRPDPREDVAAAAAGDVQAFERLYRAHAARVHSLARRFGGPSDAEEMTQEVFVRAWEKLPSFRGESAFGTWLYRMALNLLLTRWRSQRSRQARFIDDPAQVERAMQTTAAPPAKPDLLMDLERAIGRLPEGARHVYVLHDVEGYRHEEIADLLGINPGTSKSQLHRARTVLRAFLAPALSHDSDKVEGDELDAHGGELGRPA